jgi:hypothetical protein
MQVKCPQCEKEGLLQKINPRFYRVRHSIVIRIYGLLGSFNDRTFTYCRVSTEWAEQQINAEKQRYEEYVKELLGRS